MNEFIKIGKLVNTHGIKGEVKILSDFTKKDLVFKQDFILYLGKNKASYVINSYRHHKMFDMVTFNGFDNINQVLDLKGLDVYIKKDDLKLAEGDYLLEDLIGMSVVEDEEILGKVIDLMYNNGNNLLQVAGKSNFYIPINGDFIKNVDLKKQVIETKNAKGLII